MKDFPDLLYHGSYCPVEVPDIERCAQHKDFGRGFYLTSSLEQAQAFARISLRKAQAAGLAPASLQRGFVSAFSLSDSEVGEMLVHRFISANREWLRCVAAHRMRQGTKHIIERYAKFDVIAGKIANDNTNATIAAYISGVFGAVGSKQASDFCVAQLLPERLQDQFCFRTERAIQCLTFLWAKPAQR